MTVYRLFKLCTIHTVFATLLLLPSSLSAQNAPDATAAQAPNAAQGADGSGGGGGGDAQTEGLQFGVGVLHLTSVGDSDQTVANQNAGMVPRFFARQLTPEWSFEFEFAMFTVGMESKANDDQLSFSKIAEADLIFVGQSYTVLAKYGQGFRLYLGYGFNNFEVSRTESRDTDALAEELEINFEQKLSPKSGSQWLLGLEYNASKHIMIHTEYRNLLIPVEADTIVRDTATGETVTTGSSFDLTLPIYAVGVSYSF